jgi:TP901 family phage tail tape measure protein
MTDRSVVVRLKAVTSDYTAAMQRAGQTTSRVAQGITSESKRLAGGLQDVSGEATVAGAALVGIGVAAIAASTNFDKSMSKVASVSNATAGQLDKLRQQALDAGAATVFSATEAADAQAELAKAGISTADILGGALDGSLALAAAGQLSVADSATIAAQAMNQFELQGKDVTRIADTLAAGANKSAADVDQLGDALRQGGLVASQTGLSLEETVGTLSAFADRALVGSDAGTSLKTMLQRLTPQSAEAAEKMQQLGIAAYDAQGNFVGLPKLAENLKTSLSKLTPEQRNSALATIFGSDAVRGATVLYELGAKGVDEYTAAVSVQGAAAETAAKQLDNLAGDLEALRGATETALIKTGSTANGVLRETVQLATNAVTFFGRLPGPIQATGLAVAFAGGAFLLLAPRVAASVAAYRQLAIAAPRATSALGKSAKAAGKATAAFAALSLVGAAINAIGDQAVNAGKGVNELADGLARLDFEGLGTSSEEFVGALQTVANNTFFDNVGTWAANLVGVETTFDDAKNAVSGVDAALAQLVSGGNADKAAAAFARLREQFLAAGGTAEQFDKLFPQYRDSLYAVDGAASGAASSTGALAGATADADAAAQKATDALEALDAQLAILRGETQSVDEANSKLQESFDSAASATKKLEKAVKKNRSELNLGTEAGRKAQGALGGIADALFDDVIPAYAKAGRPISDVEQATEDARKAFIKAATQAGLNATAASKLADAYGLIPKKVATQYATSGTAAAVAAADEVKDAINRIPNAKTVRLTIKTDRQGNTGTGGGRTGDVTRAGGGFVYGPGTRRSDSIDMRASNGEFVTQASIAQANRPLVTAINDGRFADAARYLDRIGAGGAGGGFSIGQITVAAAPGERAEESLPRTLRREAYLLGIGEGQ